MAESKTLASDITAWLTSIGALVAILSFLWGVYVWSQSRADEIANKRLEATKPFLELQLKTYLEAIEVTSFIATEPILTEDPNLIAAKSRFWRLYHGKMALVENPEVEAAMKAFGDGIHEASKVRADSEATRNAEKELLASLALRLARMCRRSLDQSWGINAWSKPDQGLLNKN